MPHAPKVNTSIYLDAEVFRKARELGLNVSKICENALKAYIKALEKGGVG